MGEDSYNGIKRRQLLGTSSPVGIEIGVGEAKCFSCFWKAELLHPYLQCDRGLTNIMCKLAIFAIIASLLLVALSAGAAIRHRGTEHPPLRWKDEMMLRYVPGGEVSLPKESSQQAIGRSVEVKPFYMDETPVTNHQYVDFLNKVLAKITVTKGVVRGNGQIWLLLGDVIKGYRPIAYQSDKFVIIDAKHAGCAVLRVTALGAAAYAAFYGERLPTEAEWLHAVSLGGATPQHLPTPSPVMLYKKDQLGIRGLNSNIAEWTAHEGASVARKTSRQQPEYYVMGGSLGHSRYGSGINPGVRRYRWEGFSYVGFRCVLDVSKKLP